jgi:hypothetical protein
VNPEASDLEFHSKTRRQGTPENKPRTPVPRSPTTKATVFYPRLPRIPPQTHHKNTTFCDRFLPKSPIKHHKPTTKKIQIKLLMMVRPERFELPTLWFEAKCSIQLSYGRVKRRVQLKIANNPAIGN